MYQIGARLRAVGRSVSRGSSSTQPFVQDRRMTWSPLLDIRFYMVLALALAGLLALAQRLARGPSAQDLGLILLRGLNLSILVLILLNPIRIERDLLPGPPPSAVFLLDGSRSMSLEAPMSRSQAAGQVIQRAGSLMAPDRRPRI